MGFLILKFIVFYLLLTTANTELTSGLCGLEERFCLQTVLQLILIRRCSAGEVCSDPGNLQAQLSASLICNHHQNSSTM